MLNMLITVYSRAGAVTILRIISRRVYKGMIQRAPRLPKSRSVFSWLDAGTRLVRVKTIFCPWKARRMKQSVRGCRLVTMNERNFAGRRTFPATAMPPLHVVVIETTSVWLTESNIPRHDDGESDGWRYPSWRFRRTNQEIRIHVYGMYPGTTLLTSTEHANGARPADTYVARFHGNGILSRRAFSQRTVLQTLILLLHEVNYQLPSLTERRWAWFNAVDVRLCTSVHEARSLVESAGRPAGLACARNLHWKETRAHLKSLLNRSTRY